MEGYPTKSPEQVIDEILADRLPYAHSHLEGASAAIVLRKYIVQGLIDAGMTITPRAARDALQ